MQVNLNKKFKQLDGSEGMKMSEVVANILLAPSQEENASLSPVEKIRRYELAKKIYLTQEAIEISIEDAALIKTVIAKYGLPLTVAQVYEALEGK